jgi:RES domain-containing protein
MTLSAHLKRWSGAALRHIPADARFDVLDFRFAGLGRDNRWNEPGHPTLYLAGDEGVLITEWGRHFQIDRTPRLQQMTVERHVYRLELTIDQVIDLRDADVCRLLSLENAPGCFANMSVARATAHFIRGTTAAQGLLVPPMGFLDQPEQCCVVLFLDKLPRDVTRFISSVTPCGPLRLG